jgi:hypothetical protein
VGHADTETQTSGFTRVKQGLAYLVEHEPSTDVIASVYRVEVFDAVTAALPCQGVEVDAVGDTEVLEGAK